METTVFCRLCDRTECGQHACFTSRTCASDTTSDNALFSEADTLFVIIRRLRMASAYRRCGCELVRKHQRPGPVVRRLIPDAARGCDDETELRPLVSFRQRIASDC